MHVDDNEIVSELLEYEKTGNMSISVFITLNTMDAERKKNIYQLLDFARLIQDTQE